MVIGCICAVLRTPETVFHKRTDIAIACWFRSWATLSHLVRQRIGVMLKILYILYCQTAFLCVNFSGLPNCIELACLFLYVR